MKDPIQNDARKARRARLLGREPACVLCGQDNPVVLRRVKSGVLVIHHVAGVANDEALTVVVCRNCHEIHHETLRDEGIDLRHVDDRSVLAMLEQVLRSEATFFRLLADSRTAWADRLSAANQSLDGDR